MGYYISMEHRAYTKHQLKNVLVALVLLLGAAILFTDTTVVDVALSSTNAAASVADGVRSAFGY